MTMDRHIDDEALSAVLDDEATVEESDHARRCRDCSSRLAELRAVALAVGDPPSPAAPGARRASVAAGMRACPATTADHDAAAMGQPRRPPVVALQRGRGRLPRWALAAAAAVVVVVGVAVPVVTGRLDGDRDQQAATGLADDGSPDSDQPGQERSSAGDAGQAQGQAATPVVDGGDLGEIGTTSTAALGAHVEGVMAQRQAPTRPVPEPPDTGTASGPTGGIPAQLGAGPCEVAARDRDTTLGPLRYVARATLGGEAVGVLGFEPLTMPSPGAQQSLAIRVLHLETCAAVPLG